MDIPFPTDRTKLFNNAGARMMMADNISVAIDLFRGALESMLALERALHPDADSLLPILRCVTPDSVEATEDNRSSSPDPGEDDMDDGIQPLVVSAGNGRIGGARQTSSLINQAVPTEIRGFTPFFYHHPFEIPEGTNFSTEMTSAVIIFNLALVQQSMNRYTTKSAALYQIAGTLLGSSSDSREVFMLKVALLNNFGLWCYENGDGASLHRCMEHLSAIVEQAPAALSQELAEGVRENLRRLLTPSNGGSPAA